MRNAHGDSGFTLVELLIVLAISGVVLTAILQIFNTSNKSYSVQEDVAAMQQNMRVSKMFLAREVRMAGAGLASFAVGGQRLYPLEFENGVGTNGSDRLTIYYFDYDDTGCGTPPSGAFACDDLPPLTLTNKMPELSVVAEVEEELSDTTPVNYSLWLDANMTCYCKEIKYNYTTNPETDTEKAFKAMIVSPDQTRSDVFYVTHVTDNGAGSDDNIQNHSFPPGCSFADCNKVLNSFPAGSTISFFNDFGLVKVVYQVTDNVLQRSSQGYEEGVSYQPLADNIEDIQFSFGRDTDGNGSVDQWNNNADMTAAVNPTWIDQVREVRISLLGRSTKPHQGYSGELHALEDNSSGALDGRIRRELSTTVQVRNLGL